MILEYQNGPKFARPSNLTYCSIYFFWRKISWNIRYYFRLLNDKFLKNDFLTFTLERNCVELVMKLKDLGLIDLYHTTNGKEYLTPEKLKKEVLQALVANGGRSTIAELAQDCWYLKFNWFFSKNFFNLPLFWLNIFLLKIEKYLIIRN